MELLIELIVEFIFEGLVEGSLDGMESKKVPMPLRILAAVVLFAFGFFTRGVFDDRVEEAFSRVGDGFALGDGASVKVNPAGFMFVKAVVGGDFDCGRGSAEGSSPACGEKDEVRAGSR